VLADGQPDLWARPVARDFLDASECAETLRRVDRLRECWTKRSDSGFFTLGAASYLDAAKSREAYLALAAQRNPVLFNAFDDLYVGLLGFLEHVLDEPVTYDECLALPGFHIFESSGRRSESGRPSGSPEDVEADNSAAKRAHFDIQFRHAIPDWTPDATLSFTLPLAQPTAGAGLAVWHFRYEEAVRQNLPGQRFAAQNPYQRLSYQTGRMILHDGFVLHAILHGASDTAGSARQGRRITLQGHAVRCQGRWTCYW
jgi:hypothetical protein